MSEAEDLHERIAAAGARLAALRAERDDRRPAGPTPNVRRAVLVVACLVPCALVFAAHRPYRIRGLEAERAERRRAEDAVRTEHLEDRGAALDRCRSYGRILERYESTCTQLRAGMP